jgi:hypothetical protein
MTDLNQKCVGCGVPIQQPRTGRPRRYCSTRCKKADYRRRHNEIVWEPLDPAVAEHVPEPTPTPNPDEAVAGALVEARTVAGVFTNLGRRARPQLAWRCTKTGEAIHTALDDYFEGVDR